MGGWRGQFRVAYGDASSIAVVRVRRHRWREETTPAIDGATPWPHSRRSALRPARGWGPAAPPPASLCGDPPRFKG